MKTLKQRHWENCDKLIKCAYPCNSCYGCEKNEVKEWLQEHVNYDPKRDRDESVKNNKIRELIEELKQ